MENFDAEDGAAFECLDYADLESRFGPKSARVILRTLEEFEAIPEPSNRKISCEERLRNVMLAMIENVHFQTRH